MAHDHGYCRVSHLMGDVERMQSLGKELCGISVPALGGVGKLVEK
jgi:hypothetical protein